MQQKKTVLTTLTGEIFQPLRLCYELIDKDAVFKTFRRLRCMEFDPGGRRWVWLYQNEAKNLGLKVKPRSASGYGNAIVLGEFRFKETSWMTLDLRSFERATRAILFFDKHIDRKAAKVIEAIVHSKLPTGDPKQYGNLAALFENVAVRPVSLDITPEIETRKPGESVVQRAIRLFSSMKTISRMTPPAFERIPIHYYEDGILPFESALKMRTIIAVEHWNGNTSFTYDDFMSNLVAKMKP